MWWRRAVLPSLPWVVCFLSFLLSEFAERRKFYTEYVAFWASFGIRILEYVWNTAGILPIRVEYSPRRGRLEYVEYVFRE